MITHPLSQELPGFVHPIGYDYLPVLVFACIALGLSLLMTGLPFLLTRRYPNRAKNAPYECGFDVFEDARIPFDVRFYLVAILFIIFDLEIAFLFPWAMALRDIGVAGFISMMVFLGVLTVGFAYEWRKGALRWE